MGPILQEQVCYTLYSTSNVIKQAYRGLLIPLELTYPQFVVMMALWQKDQVSVTELAITVNLSNPTMTPLLKRLESLGYITREFQLGDERQKCITLTKKGRELVVKGDEAANKALCETGLSNQEAEQLIALCQKIKVNLA